MYVYVFISVKAFVLVFDLIRPSVAKEGKFGARSEESEPTQTFATKQTNSAREILASINQAQIQKWVKKSEFCGDCCALMVETWFMFREWVCSEFPVDKYIGILKEVQSAKRRNHLSLTSQNFVLLFCGSPCCFFRPVGELTYFQQAILSNFFLLWIQDVLMNYGEVKIEICERKMTN